MKIIKKDKPDTIPVPKCLQDIIPIKTISPDGIFEVARGKWSKTFKFEDINYSVAGREQKKTIAMKYAEVLNSLDPDIKAQITVNRRKMNMEEFEKETLMKKDGSELDRFRDEYNRIIMDAAKDANMLVRELYITITVNKSSYEDAKSALLRIETGLSSAFYGAGSELKDMDATERLHILYDFYRAGEETGFNLDLKDMIRHGRDARTYICPDTFKVFDDYVKMGNRYARILLIRELASYVKDNIVSRLTDINNTSMMSFSINPVPSDVAVQEVENRLMGIEKNIAKWQKRQNKMKLYSSKIPYQMEQQLKELKEFLGDLTTRDQRMMYVTMTIVHTADSLEELNSDTEKIINSGRSALCQIVPLTYQQYEGLNTVLPWGLNLIDYSRTMITESMLAFTPFYVQEVNDEKGCYYGKNKTSKGLIRINKTMLKNGNMMILAVPGAGKSVLGKNEGTYQYLSDPNTDVIFIDPEREYTLLVEALKGEVIKISTSGDTHINLMDINDAYGIEDKPVPAKVEFITSVCEQILGEAYITAGHKSIIDRCVRKVYREYVSNNYTGEEPTLVMLYEELIACKEEEAQDLALALERFANGTLNNFAKKTNVNTESRLLCYDLYDMGEQLWSVGMLVVLDNIRNRVSRNRFSGRRTIVIIEEMYLYLSRSYTAEFFFKLWKQIRKYNGYCVGITQNVIDLRKSDTARTMLANSEFVILLSQAEDDLEDLRSLLKLSEEQVQHVNGADEGCGLIKIGKTVIPFENKIPKDTELYRLMTTKPGEVMYGG